MSNQVNESKIIYRQVGDYQIPNITLPHEETKVELGMWGMKHKDYLMKNKRILFYISQINQKHSTCFAEENRTY